MTEPPVPGLGLPPQGQPPAPSDPGAAPAPPDASGGSDSTEELNRLRTEAGRMRAAIKKLEGEADAARQANMGEQEKAVAAAKAAGAAEWEHRWRSAKRENAALGVLSLKGVTATELALRSLELDDIEVDPQTGRVDTTAIEAKVADLLKRYPMLGPSTAPPVGSVNGGDQRRGVPPPTARGGLTESNARNEALRWALRDGS